jgi:hypothetical protein
MTNESKRQLYLSHSEEEGFQKFAVGESIQAGDKCGVHLLGIGKCDVRGLVSFVPLSAPFVGTCERGRLFLVLPRLHFPVQ